MNSNTSMMKTVALWVVIALIGVMLFHLFNTQPAKQASSLSFSEFLQVLEKGQVKEVTIQGSDIKGTLAEGKSFTTYAPEDPRLVERLTEKNVSITAKPKDESPWYLSALISWIPMLLLIGVWILFMRQMQSGGTKAMSFGRSKARLMTQDKMKVTFADVAGVDEAKEELEEIIEFLKEPKRFTSLGGRIPKGVLLLGPPGTGKTLLAKAVAGEAGVPFFSMSGSDFVEMFVGVGASRVRDLFAQGKQHAPCIIFIDEIDAVGRHRGAGLGGGHDEREQTLNQLLVEMDGFESNEGVILMAATNRPDVLDPALLRPGRFDRQVVVASPDVKGREGILKVHSRNIPLADDINMATLAKATPGFSGADLSNLVNEAALLAARRKRTKVSMEDMEQAKDKVLMGVERKSMVISEEEKKTTAYHEAGHALVAKKLPNADPVYKVSIIPRGRAMGITQQLPLDDRHTYSKDFLLATISVLMGGRAAEELVLGHLTTGAGNDIERATDMARHMVTEWGMSSLGPLSFGKVEQEMFLGREISKRVDYSELTAQKIDNEVKTIIMECYAKTRSIVESNLDSLHKIARTLLEKEVLDGSEIDRIVEEGAAAG
ncbi:MAG TPA: ATP-dependent zinc metalloprotease FtsH [Deltaproteobacteria bacterium]|jgi:cell division protease FtsH|nr:ATP-dependent zinc metalloprotease FtsH [Deltaproteobacteria bacterium]HRW79290.1 ATP-dependent zinc metalloprotease FtsH [Desulfomonilia bacterium]HNQ84792.1 ATP-dependent zinc metalloprotease FtsH [Deltaproteobacteria bacterium]HNS89596.1 ATP-dependent zinc metalloprotease FtsH [Deltaproteobacteria bacterium]HOA44147.1 ATP-dependent zinc metalloprotease FtsH [Deltaproteobacteria bacterium]